MAGLPRLICAASNLDEGGDGVRFEVDIAGCVSSAFVVRWRGQVYGYLNRCAHVAVELDWNPGKFIDESGLYLVCATHGALYEPDTGWCVAGPCHGRNLQPLDVIERDGNVYLISDS